MFKIYNMLCRRMSSGSDNYVPKHGPGATLLRNTTNDLPGPTRLATMSEAIAIAPPPWGTNAYVAAEMRTRWGETY